jgi:hypothetical protein
MFGQLSISDASSWEWPLQQEYRIILLKGIFVSPQSPGPRQPVLALSKGMDLLACVAPV